ncbi:hypothetical protein [uncultured Rikenella sp.]|uniref:hypothetical protein n=1 Tax=uncultured Rikenella sp. TaxID=368003 RepID=UPI002618D43A|nr:hypothetical protein [uncultured Rikenella sp.]
METFLTVILFLFVVFWLLGLFGRWTLRWWIARKQREFQQQFGSDGKATGGTFGDGSFRGFYANFGGSRKKKREGEVTVTHTNRHSEYQVGKSVGEYIEYEEVENSTTTAPDRKE